MFANKNILGFAIALCFTVALSSYLYTEKSIDSDIASYTNNPTKNAVIIVYREDAAYPYELYYIPTVNNTEAVLLRWCFGYKTESDARKDIGKLISSLSKGKIETDFADPISVQKCDFCNIRFVRYLDREYDWQKPVSESLVNQPS